MSKPTLFAQPTTEYQLHPELLRYWTQWLQENDPTLCWSEQVIRPSLGLERNIDILWLAVLLPSLQGGDTIVPTWMRNAQTLSKIYHSGIDLLDAKVLRDMEVGDLQGMFTTANTPSVAKDIAMTLHQFVQFQKAYGHPANALRQSHGWDIWSQQWTDWSGKPFPVHLYDLAPTMDLLLQQLHRQPQSPLVVSHIAIQVLWSSGLLDLAIHETEEVLPIDDAGRWALYQIQQETELSAIDITRKLQAFFEHKIDCEPCPLRPWMWGHTPLLFE